MRASRLLNLNHSTRHQNHVFEPLDPRVLLAFTNVLVNDPAEDLTSQNTQSETCLVVFGPNIIVGYNDSGADTNLELQFTGWSRSDDGGATFVDMGNLPLDTDFGDQAQGDEGDPVLARDNQTGMIYFATLSDRTQVGILVERQIQVFRSRDDGLTFDPDPPPNEFPSPVNATSGLSRVTADKPW